MVSVFIFIIFFKNCAHCKILYKYYNLYYISQYYPSKVPHRSIALRLCRHSGGEIILYSINQLFNYLFVFYLHLKKEFLIRQIIILIISNSPLAGVLLIANAFRGRSFHIISKSVCKEIFQTTSHI